MPKDRSSRVSSYESRRAGASPYFSSSHGQSSSCRRSEESCGAAAAAAAKQAAEWEDVRCPVCMDHPHNAVLLVCSSHEKGCRPFMCDTSSRHSNCYDQYRKASKDSRTECSECQQQVQLSCPLCRGPVSDCIKDYSARRFMNTKVRSCTTESCEFRGAYQELRKHARVEHPTGRPMEVDPERQRDWRRMEQQRDLGDLMSMLRSGFNSNIEDDSGGLGDTEEGGEEAEMTPASITMVFIMPSRGSIMQYLSERSRTIILVSRRRASSSSGGDAEATAPDSEEGDDPMPSAEASAGSQHSSEQEEADGDPAQ
ncbi:hypothetical protein Zm00014a_039610 [Zea mays]|jgi:hypothetical protein|uniref:Uncharacterized protein n=3 Tax=Zea mays TaxID=4577 RepID=B4G170_MAIZE|nr:uncharacterized protein LOC100279543 [Zea mays]XP_008672706.1 uncharacterized protein LOC100279543 isoform X1 [Zea mays]XP_008672707.1 uncharacterized protein LOC100279543 isoform X1 [Zea mays]ACF88113.1 unknown [Zea mays]ACG38514.1 hypothetical protein [Zea mays]ACG40192.1 hypothetical protein [Zea mays]ACG40521.1 hypothetical protein [Zea mays]ACL53035.1 unknown [Zea mays]|eukprot:NP_001146012.1 uncharacterized protein LOC100279543 [Zea mays]